MEKDCFITLFSKYSSIQFSCSVVSNSLWPHGLKHTRPPCPSPTPRAYSNSCSLSQWCHPTISSSVIPFSSHLQSFPASGSFPMSQLIRWAKYWSSHYEFLLWIPTVTFLTERKFRGNSLTQVAQWSRIGLPGQETQETWVQSLGREDPLEEGMATCSSILVWRTPWTEEPGGPQSMGSQRLQHDWSCLAHTYVQLYL